MPVAMAVITAEGTCGAVRAGQCHATATAAGPVDRVGDGRRARGGIQRHRKQAGRHQGGGLHA
ncbi:hypothetical protein NGF19_21065 [Streptomyces sp. RY43-2]|uniref:Uncharacterized protein n=1 Tax=Streptomyces macrolidinus TaxID=2952607 RepID=A0ABT0ZI35_9ACTN|nr:hypothetical protein [Streptomyces macrolidinus]MCN9243245.1 hypothetical protein [Streptomyces macrolidinus]